MKQQNPARVVSHQRGEPAANTLVDALLGVGRVGFPHPLALFGGNHFEGQLVMAAQKSAPLAALRQLGGTCENLFDRSPVTSSQCHIKARHKWEVEIHVHFVSAAEIFDHFFGPHIGFAQ